VSIYNKIGIAAQKVGISKTMLKAAVLRGDVKHARTGIGESGHYLVDMESLAKYLNSFNKEAK